MYLHFVYLYSGRIGYATRNRVSMSIPIVLPVSDFTKYRYAVGSSVKCRYERSCRCREDIFVRMHLALVWPAVFGLTYYPTDCVKISIGSV